MQQHLVPGTILSGQYRIVRFIAQGGFGCTYEAEHILLENHPTVAIKEFFPKTLCDRNPDTNHMTVASDGNVDMVDKLRKKFIAEANAVSTLSHPGIVKVITVFLENNTAYFVMDFIKGESLGSILKKKRKKRLSCDEALRYIREVAQTLGYVHSQGRLHLDIKPDNILINESGRTVLIDFGVSKQAKDDGGLTTTIIGYSAGFAPPEQVNRRIEALGRPSDIYALGATLYCMLTGSHPNADELLVYPDDVPQNVRNAIDACLQSIVKMRPQSIDEFLAILDGKVEAEKAPQPISAPVSIPHDKKDTKAKKTNEDDNDDTDVLKDPTIIDGETKPKPTSPKPVTPNDAPKSPEVTPIRPETNNRKKWLLAIFIVALLAGIIGVFLPSKSDPTPAPAPTPDDTTAAAPADVDTAVAVPAPIPATPEPDTVTTPAKPQPTPTKKPTTTTKPKPITTYPTNNTSSQSSTAGIPPEPRPDRNTVSGRNGESGTISVPAPKPKPTIFAGED